MAAVWAAAIRQRDGCRRCSRRCLAAVRRLPRVQQSGTSVSDTLCHRLFSVDKFGKSKLSKQ